LNWRHSQIRINDIKNIEARMWSESMRLSWYDSAIDTVTMDIPPLERPHSGHIKNFTTQLTWY